MFIACCKMSNKRAIYRKGQPQYSTSPFTGFFSASPRARLLPVALKRSKSGTGHFITAHITQGAHRFNALRTAIK